MAFNIKTPAGVTLKTDNVSMEFEFSHGFSGEWSGHFDGAQRIVDSEVLRYNSPYVPFDSGTLDKSGILHTVIGSGEVVYKTPYAARMYYNPQYNFQDAPTRGAYWFERAKVNHKDDILRSAGRAFPK